MATRRRTRARELALQHLYAVDQRADGLTLEPGPFLRAQTKDDEVYLFAIGLVNGCLAHRQRIDEAIRRAAENWDFERLAAVDRNILRLGVYELLFREDIPPQVTLNEAIELAKRFSTAKSGAFVNGVLDRVRGDAGREPCRAPLPRAAGEEAAPEPDGETAETLDDLDNL